MGNWVRLRRLSHAPRELDGTETIYAAADGTLMHMDPEGSETEFGAGGGGISEITSDDESVTITNSTGPTVDLSATGGGSQPFKYVDLGTFGIADLASGPILLYTPDTDEEIIAVFVTAWELTDHSGLCVGYIDEPVPDVLITDGGTPTALATVDNGGVYDTPRMQAPGAHDAPWNIRNQALYGAWIWDPTAANPSRAWEPGKFYPVTDDDTMSIVAAGRFWGNTGGSSGTSGLSEPDFAGNLDGTVADGPDLVWNDIGSRTSTVTGSLTARALVAIPAAP